MEGKGRVDRRYSESRSQSSVRESDSFLLIGFDLWKTVGVVCVRFEFWCYARPYNTTSSCTVGRLLWKNSGSRVSVDTSAGKRRKVASVQCGMDKGIDRLDHIRQMSR